MATKLKSKTTEVKIGTETLELNKAETLISIIKLIRTERPRSVLRIISASGEKGINVGTICKKTERLSQANASILLGKFRKLNLVKTERNSQMIFYSINNETVAKLNAALQNF